MRLLRGGDETTTARRRLAQAPALNLILICLEAPSFRNLMGLSPRGTNCHQKRHGKATVHVMYLAPVQYSILTPSLPPLPLPSLYGQCSPTCPGLQLVPTCKCPPKRCNAPPPLANGGACFYKLYPQQLLPPHASFTQRNWPHPAPPLLPFSHKISRFPIPQLFLCLPQTKKSSFLKLSAVPAVSNSTAPKYSHPTIVVRLFYPPNLHHAIPQGSRLRGRHWQRCRSAPGQHEHLRLLHHGSVEEQHCC